MPEYNAQTRAQTRDSETGYAPKTKVLVRDGSRVRAACERLGIYSASTPRKKSPGRPIKESEIESELWLDEPESSHVFGRGFNMHVPHFSELGEGEEDIQALYGQDI